MLSDIHALSYARAFGYWCYQKDVMNPTIGTLCVWLEYNCPRDGSKFMDDVYENIEKIWDNLWKVEKDN